MPSVWENIYFEINQLDRRNLEGVFDFETVLLQKWSQNHPHPRPSYQRTAGGKASLKVVDRQVKADARSR